MKIVKITIAFLIVSFIIAQSAFAWTNVTNLKITQFWTGNGSFTVSTVNSSGTVRSYYFEVGRYGNNADAIKMLLSAAQFAFLNNMFVDIISQGTFNTSADYADQMLVHY